MGGRADYRGRNRAYKAIRHEITAAVRDIRADTDPLTVKARRILSARRMARAEYEGVEFTDDASDHERKAMQTLARLWPRKANGMLRRLRRAGIFAVSEEA